MRCFSTFVWLLTTTSLAFPSGDQNQNYYTKTSLRPPSNKRSTTPTITGNHFTKQEFYWLHEKSLTDVNSDGLKETTIALKNLFGKNNIPWVISGGWALILYGEPERITPDIDIIVQTTMPNLRNVLETDKRFLIPVENWWRNKLHFHVFFKTQNKYIDVDIIIAGEQNSAKEVAKISKYISTTHKNAKVSIPVIRPGPLFVSKVLGLAWMKRCKTSQDVKDITYLLTRHWKYLYRDGYRL
ncbi:hypothetical protein PpBr36_02327 [Pyricularia pennisetigena]|uniref:hypothetical protein n=1 Tax=Pyricularia pennisetigena TaxID=1578925 RepID=UPI00114DB10B|nr:hypothetical protein PpBr36_02327 [Pyricularia pennisetigena]TLS30424.1 hypothetical protein PpBr36_02327 [Pyricularia pennisetigena]